MLVAQSCPTLCDPMSCSLPGSSVHGILQARILEWVAFPFSRGSSQAKDWTQVSWIAGRSFTVWATREAPHLINEERILKFHHRHSTTFNQSSDSDCGRHWLPMSPKSRGACASGWRYTSPVGCFLPKTEPQSSDTPTQYWLPGGIKHSECGQAKWECALSVTYIPEGKNLAWKKAWKIP